MKILLASSFKEIDREELRKCKSGFINLTGDPGQSDFKEKTDAFEIDISEKLRDSNYVKDLTIGYLDMMSGISKENNHIFWWSTFTSSKNRFMTDTFVNLCNFHSLTGCIDDISENKKSDLIAVIASPGIISATESYLTKKGILFENRTSGISRFREIIRNHISSTKNKAIFTFVTWQRIFSCRMKLGKKIENLLKKPAENPYVIRTWIYERSFSENNDYKDSFFGILPDYISKKGQVIIIGGLIGNYPAICEKIGRAQNHIIIPQEYFLSYGSPLKSLLELRKNRIRIKDAYFCGNDVSGIINYELKKEYSDRWLPESFQFSYFIGNMLKKIRPGDFLTTYENNPWEKVCFMKLRELSGRTRILGYQHSVLSRYSLNMFFPKGALSLTPKPDKVVTVGGITRKILIESGGYGEEMVFSGCGLRFMHLFNLKERRNPRNFRTILVTPEGIPDESVKICNFVHEALKDAEEIKVVIRPHPALPFEKFAKDLTFKIDEVPNFEISGKPSVMDDLNIADIVIYRGSTLSLEAVKTGLYAVYLDLGDLIPVDPLFGLTALKGSVKAPGEMRDLIESIYSMSDSRYREEMNEASLYLDDYFHRVSEDSMDVFLN